MNWFLDLFGSYENPRFQKPYVTDWDYFMKVINEEIESEIEIISRGWCHREEGNLYQYAYGDLVTDSGQKYSKSSPFVVSRKHPVSGHPSIVEYVHNDGSDVYYVEATDPMIPDLIFKLYDGVVKDINLTFSSNRAAPMTIRQQPIRIRQNIRLQYDTVNECKNIDIFTTDFYKDDVTKIAIMAALDKHDLATVDKLIAGAA